MRARSSFIPWLVTFGVAAAMVALPTTARATFPGANGVIAFAGRAGGGTYDVFLINPDGTGLANITNHAANDRDPAISPDGTQIAFRTDRDGNDEIYIMNVDGTSPTRLTNDAAQDFGPAWSPDGTEIVWARQPAGSPPFVHVMNTDGTNDRALARGGGTPQFSPDGQRITFERLLNPPSDTPRAVLIMNADGTNVRQVTPGSLNGGMADWSPDGNRIVFASEICGCPESDLYTIKANGKDLQRLTNFLGTGVNAHEPVWAPNGRQILFTHWDDLTFSTADLYLVNVDGTGLADVTNTSGVIEREADWEPLTGD